MLMNQAIERAAHPGPGAGAERPLLNVVRERRVPRQDYVPAGRNLHLVDIENLMGGPYAGPAAMLDAIDAYQRAAKVTTADLIVIGVNPALAISASHCWPGARVEVGRGPNGADLALLGSVSDVTFTAARFDGIVIGSGDGIFAAVVDEYKNAGLPVIVVSRARSLAHVLAARATAVRLIPDRWEPEVAA